MLFSRLLLVVLIFSTFCSARADEILVSNNVTGPVNPDSGPYVANQVVSPNISFSGIVKGPGLLGIPSKGRYNSHIWTGTSVDASDYFSFQLTPAANVGIEFSKLELEVGDNTAQNNLELRSSLDNFTTAIGSATVVRYRTSSVVMDLTARNIKASDQPIEFRLYAWGHPSNMAQFSITKFAFKGTLTGVRAETAADSDTLVSNKISGVVNPESGPFEANQFVDPRIAFSGIVKGPGLRGIVSGGRYNADLWTGTSIDFDDYFAFRLAPPANSKIQFRQLELEVGDNSAQNNIELRSSVDDFTSSIAITSQSVSRNTATSVAIDLANPNVVANDKPIEFRLYAWGHPSNIAQFSITKFAFKGAITNADPIPVTLPDPNVDPTVLFYDDFRKDVGWKSTRSILSNSNAPSKWTGYTAITCDHEIASGFGKDGKAGYRLKLDWPHTFTETGRFDCEFKESPIAHIRLVMKLSEGFQLFSPTSTNNFWKFWRLHQSPWTAGRRPPYGVNGELNTGFMVNSMVFGGSVFPGFDHHAAWRGSDSSQVIYREQVLKDAFGTMDSNGALHNTKWVQIDSYYELGDDNMDNGKIKQWINGVPNDFYSIVPFFGAAPPATPQGFVTNKKSHYGNSPGYNQFTLFDNYSNLTTAWTEQHYVYVDSLTIYSKLPPDLR